MLEHRKLDVVNPLPAGERGYKPAGLAYGDHVVVPVVRDDDQRRADAVQVVHRREQGEPLLKRVGQPPQRLPGILGGQRDEESLYQGAVLRELWWLGLTGLLGQFVLP